MFALLGHDVHLLFHRRLIPLVGSSSLHRSSTAVLDRACLSTGNVKDLGRPTPLQFARSQKVVTTRLYASMLANKTNHWNSNTLKELLQDWRDRCWDKASAKDTAVILTAASGAAGRAGLPKLGTSLAESIPSGHRVPPGTLRKLLEVSLHARCSSSARRLIALIERDSTRTMVDMTNAVQACLLEDPTDMVREALDAHLPLDNWSTTVLMLACSDNGDPSLTDAVWDRAMDQGLSVTEQTLSAYLSALGDFSQGKRALQVANDHPHLMNNASFISLLTALSHSDLSDEALSIFRGMETPNQTHANCTVDALARKGRLEEACDILQELDDGDAMLQEKSEEHRSQLAFGWMTILGGSVQHNNLEVAERAANQVKRLSLNQQEQKAAHMLVGHAQKGSSELDKTGERLPVQLQKEQGKSTVVLGKSRISFVANDLISFYINGVPQELGSIMRQRIRARFQQWGNPCQHSEKIALAFALEQGERHPVLFKNNAGMCPDCHESILKITIQERMEVHYRNQNQWHTIKHGVSSRVVD